MIRENSVLESLRRERDELTNTCQQSVLQVLAHRGNGVVARQITGSAATDVAKGAVKVATIKTRARE